MKSFAKITGAVAFMVVGAASARPRRGLVDATQAIPDLVLDLRYATPHNFLGRPVYPPDARCWLRPEAATKLKVAADSLRTRGFRLVVYDCYRPLSVQRQMWSLFPRRGYVANPRFGGQHNRGAAVDVGLAGMDGSPVEMPTDFDTFSRAAYQSYSGGSEIARQHRAVLRQAMEAAGFQAIRMEWWHYALPHSARYAVMDVPLEGV